MEKILVIRYGTIGDTVFASAFYRELRKALPDARIDILADEITESVMRNCPYINKSFYIDGKYKNLFGYLSLFRKYDTIYFLKSDKFFTRVAFLAGVKNRIGFDTKRNKFLTLKAPYKEDRHEIDCYLDLLHVSGKKVTSDKTELWLDEISVSKVSTLLNGISGKKVLIQAYSRFQEKNWLDEYWVQVV
ncbi:glycosyltransferase family 9 protein, partial [bacterium]|nr:glycosyltransferase family 9 protein [bacterium]